MATIKKACKGVSYPKSSSVSKRLGSPSKAKNGKSFPDLNKDGKITKADILKGRGVIAKKGMKVKKAKNGVSENPFAKANQKKVKAQMDANKNPTFNPSFTNKGVTKTYETDTTGLAGGRKMFPFKRTMQGEEPLYGTVGRGAVKSALAKQGQKQKTGGVTKKSMKTGGKMTKKCMYGCK